MNDKIEKLGRLIDELDNLAHALKIPFPADMHVSTLQAALPEKVKKFKAAFVDLTGENPWEFHPENIDQP